MSFEILKSPYLFWSSFFEGLFKWMFLASNYTLSPFFNLYRFHLFLLNYFFIISCANSINFMASSQLLCSSVKNSSNFGNSVYTVRLPFYRCLPKLSTNGVCSIATYFLSLYWNFCCYNLFCSIILLVIDIISQESSNFSIYSLYLSISLRIICC